MIYELFYIAFLGLVAIGLFLWMVSNLVSVLLGAPAISSPPSMGWKKFADPTKTFLDIGCGGGTVLLRAAPYFKHVYGIEGSPMYYLVSKYRTRHLPNVTVLFGNFFYKQWPKVDYIYCYLLTDLVKKLKPKFIAANTPVMSLCFQIVGWESSEQLKEVHRTLHVYYPPFKES